MKLDFDLFPGVATPISSSIPAIQTQIETLILTSALSFQTPSSAVFSASAASAEAAFAFAAASSKASHDNNVRVGVGVGVGAGVGVGLLAVICLTLVRRRSAKNKKVSEEKMRARWKMDNQAGLMDQNQPRRSHQRSELGDAAGGGLVEADGGGLVEVDGRGLVEADDGRPNEIAMLENRPAVARERAPGTFSSRGNISSNSGVT